MSNTTIRRPASARLSARLSARPLQRTFALRPISLAACLLGTAPASFGLPQGATPTFGQATVVQTAPGQLSIQQSSARAGLDWTRFSIAAGERVNVVQPSRDAVLLNRVLGDDPSLIYGTLHSNGSVWLINPRGIVFGAGSRVDVGSLVASTLSITAQDPASGRLQLARASAAQGEPGELRSEGLITAPDGTVALVAPRLLHSGRIEARRVGLAAAGSVLVDVEGDGLVFFNARSEGLQARLSVLGNVLADGGSAELRAAARASFADTVLNLEGVVQARSLGMREGRIVIDGGAEGLTRIAGRLDATSVGGGGVQGHADGRGGDVLVQGAHVLLDRGTVVDASGAGGGGRVRVGGDFQGANPEVRNALRVGVMPGVRLAANAQEQGDGGTVIVWSDEATRFHGAADVRGGAAGGNGGLVEVSGKAYLDYRGSADRSAPRGRAGTLLLDPTDLTIQAATPDLNGDTTPGDDLSSTSLLFAAAGADSRITAGAVQTQLGLGSVTLQASNNISVAAAITSASANSLLLQAGNSIAVSAPISVGGGLTLSANDATSPARTASGNVALTAALTAAGTVTISNNGGSGVHQIGANISANTLAVTGDLALTAATQWTLAGASTLAGSLSGSGSLVKAGAGVLTLNGNSSFSGATSVNGGGLTLGGTLASTSISIGSGGTLALAAADRLADTASVDVSGGTLTLAGNDTIGTLTLAGGTLSGTGALSAGALSSSGGSSLRVTVNASTATVTDGTLTVGNGATAGALVASTSTTINAGATLAFARSDNIAFGSIAGSGTLRQAGAGDLLLSGTAPGLDAVNVASGSLTLGNGSSDRIKDSATLTVSSGAAVVLGNNDETVGSLVLAGTLNGTRKLTAGSGSYTLQAGSTVNAELGAGTLQVSGNSTLNASSDTTAVNITAGTLTLGSANLLSNSADVTVAASAGLTLSADETVATLTLAGTLAGGAGNRLTAATYTLQSGAVVGADLGAGTLQVSGNSTLNASTGTTAVNITTGTLTLGSANLLPNSADVTVAAGAGLTLSANETVATLTLAGTLDGGTANTLTTTGLATLAGASVQASLQADSLVHTSGSSTLRAPVTVTGSATLSGGTLNVGNGAAAGTLAAATISLAGGALVLASGNTDRIANTSNVSVSGGSTLTLNNASETIAALTLADGTVAGSGTLSATSLSSSGSSTLSAAVSTATASVTGGTLTVGNGATAGALAASTSTTVSSGATLSFARSDNIAFGSIAGSGTLRHAGSGTLTLGGSSPGLAGVQVTGSGNLVLANGSGNRLNDSAAVTVNTGATFTLGDNGETVGSLSLAGVLAGSTTLTAATYTLQAGAQVDANLGAGTLNVSGNSTLAGTALAAAVNVNSGTLTLGAAERLDNASVVTVASGAGLTLTAAEQVGSLVLAGTLSGTGFKLSAGAYTLQSGAQVDANLGAGTLTVTGSATLNGTADATPVLINNGGTLLLGAAERLDDNADLTVALGGRLTLNGDERVGTLSAPGTVGGSGTLSVNFATLNNSAINTPLTATTLTSDGISTIRAAVTVTGAADVNSGVLTVGDGATAGSLTAGTLTVASGATLAFNRSDLVTLGPVAGSGTLRQAGSGELQLTSSVAASAVQVNAGTLSLATGSTDRLSNSAAVSVLNGATLTLNNGTETVGSLALAGTLNGAGVLSATTYTLQAGGNVLAGLGAGTLDVSGNSTLAGSSGAGTVNINFGTLTLAAAERLLDTAAVTVSSNAGLTLSAAETVATLTLAGTLDGAAHKLTAATTTLQAGSTVNADLGPGTLVVTGNSTLAGTADAATVNVNAGTLTLASADRLNNAAAVTVAALAGLALNGNDSVGSLTSAGTLSGGGRTLTASTYTLQAGASVSANLGSGTLVVTGVTGNSTLSGTAAAHTVSVQSGTLATAGANRLASSANVTVAASGTLALGGDETVASLALSGALAGAGRTLTATSYTLLAGADAGANLGSGTLNVGGNSTLGGTAQVTTVNLGSGTLTLGAAGRLAAGAAVVVAGGATLALGGDETLGSLAGTGAVNLQSSTLSTGALASSTFAGVLSGSGGLIKLGGTTFTLTGTNTYAGPTRVQAGTLAQGAADALSNASIIGVDAGATLALAGNDTVAGLVLSGTLAGGGTLSAPSYALDGGQADASLGAGVLATSGNSHLNGSSGASTVDVNSGTLTLGAANRLSSAATVHVASGATLTLNGDETVGALVLSGTVGGVGTLSASSYSLAGGVYNLNLGSGTLTSSGNGLLNGSSAASSVTITGGTLTLGAAGRLTAAPAVTVNAGAALSLGGDESFGSLAGAGAVNLQSFTLSTGALASSTFAGVLSGSGGLTKRGSSTFTLTGANTYSGLTRVQAGTLAQGTADALSDASTLSVDAGSTLALAGSDTVAGLQLAGTLAGSGLLTAPRYTLLAGAQVDGNLGAGALDVNGSSRLNGTSGAATVAVNAGTLTLGAADRLNDAATVTVAGGGALALNGDETVGALVLSGSAGGVGTLSARTYALNGGIYNLNLGGGAITSSGNGQLNGSSAASSVTVTGGTLTLAAANRLTAAPAVTVNAGAALNLAGEQTFGALAGAGAVGLAGFTLATGTRGDSTFSGLLSGSGGLRKQGPSTFTLGGDSTYTGLTRVEGGTLAVAGTLASATLAVDAGTLALGAANRLADTATVHVASGAALTLNGDETVAALVLAGSTGGVGTLSARTYALNGGVYNLNLGRGAITSSGDGLLNGSSAADSLAVTGGTLTLAAASRLTAAPAVTVHTGAALNLGGDQLFGSLGGAGAVGLAGFTLFTGALGDSTFSGALSGTGSLVKQGASTFTLAGANTYTGATRVEAGTLALGAADRLADATALSVAAGAAFTLAGHQTVAALALAGRLGGAGTLTAATYALDGGTANADLGAGALASSGASALNGSSAADTVAVNTGSLTLGPVGRLSATAAVSVAADAAFNINTRGTVASLALQGTLGGSGTLTAARYALDGGTANAHLGSGALSSVGASTLNGTSAAGSVAVNGGTLVLGAADRFTALPAVTVDTGATLRLAGSQTLGALAGAGAVDLQSFTLTTGVLADATFAGVLQGAGSLSKQGDTTFTLTGANTYTGLTRVQAGTLRVGDGASAGSLASGAFQVDGTLSLARADDVALAQPVSGSGNLEQAGSGRLTLAGGNKSYSGQTRVTRGELATAGSQELPNAGDVLVSANGRLTLGGAQTLRTLDADGAVALAGDLSASQDLLLRGATTATGGVPLTLAGQRIEASNDGNRWGSSLSLQAGGAIDISSGRDGGSPRDLVLGRVSAAAGGTVNAGTLTLGGPTTVSGGTLALVSSAARTVTAPGEDLRGKQSLGLPVAYAADAIQQDAAGRIEVAAGAGLSLHAINGGSVQLLHAGNSFLGSLSVLSGTAGSAWSTNSTPFSGPTAQNVALQSRVRINGLGVNVGGSGIEADVVAIRAERLATTGAAVIVARMPFDNTAGTEVSVPGLVLELAPGAFDQTFPFGRSGADGAIRISVGSRAFGGRTLPIDAGFLAVLPRGGARGSTVVQVSGPQEDAAGGYRFFFSGARQQSEIPVFYNGVLPVTPQVESSISTTVSVSEGARKERFEEAVRTENVAVRLRSGVIAEVGAGRPATVGADGARAPLACAPAAGALSCGAGAVAGAPNHADTR